MMPVLGPSAIREADAWTIQNEPISSWALMERASTRCVERIQAILNIRGLGRLPADVSFLVVCGMGNNGGDGLAIARLLHGAGHGVRVWRVKHRAAASEDNRLNLEKALALGIPLIELEDMAGIPAIDPNEVVIDALFGTGLTTGVTGWVAELIEFINKSERPVVAIDMPSGLFGEPLIGVEQGAVVRATHALTFHVPKLAFFFAENAPLVVEWEVLPIGLDQAFVQRLGTNYRLLEERDLRALLEPRPRFAHKGSFGHALFMGGSEGKMGAAVLATRAALRSGVGLVTTHVPKAGLNILQCAAPEAMCSVDQGGSDAIKTLPDLALCTAVGFGPGVGVKGDTALVLKNLIRTVSINCVIDADGLNILAANPTWLAFLPQGTILTPHPKEFDRLAGVESKSGYDRLQRARELAVRCRCHVVLKGAWTAVCDPAGQVIFNPTGNPGMAKGGSGDVLTGLLTGLLAQGFGPQAASLLGVYLHGLAGDLAAARLGMDGMTANDIVEHLPAAWKQLRKGSEQMLG